ncbi:unnamed protein product [Brachionus calyciflorus]|uniref:Phospholipid/glycerol acyltransferase domain-containing protein n=1 Tax=Brachionus calyciflorus TaxID=104777 RepID=A0A814ANK2_9BILA|nr:unnamed protein product [Brachionus calyciflorus]
MEGFSDLLDEIKRIGGPLFWVTQKKNFVENIQTLRKRSPDQIKRDVLSSDRLRHVIDKILEKQSTQDSLSHKVTKTEIEQEAKKIIDEMAHDFDLKYVRLMGYILIKVFSNIYKHIFYNNDILDNMAVMKHYPTILLPLHRSYMDFLLVSIICFHKNLQLPTIAAGQDFLSMSFVSKAIRHCGAFFIRRSFGSDELYWAIFHEYVQQHLKNCERPLEFFIEGTRSRTSKSLNPKQGMLSTCVELFMRGHRCQDIYFIPISLTYERLLEEILYSNELLGIPKPKESVSGLVKARAILKECYGSIFINFSRPISLREVLFLMEGPSPTNSSNLLNPSFIFELSKPQYKQIESLSYHILIQMLRNQVIQPISLISTCLLVKNRSKFNTFLELDLKSLTSQCLLLKSLLKNLGVKVYWPIENEIDGDEKLILENLKIHENLFDFNRVDFISLKQFDEIFENACNYIALCSYKNQLANSLVRMSFACTSLLLSSPKDDEFNLKESFEIYKFMTRVYAKEFIFKSGDESKDFEDSIKFLINTSLIQEKGEMKKIEINKFNVKKFLFLSVLFEKLFKNYVKIYSILSNFVQYHQLLFDVGDEKKLFKDIQSQIFDEMKQNSNRLDYLYDYEVLSLSTIGNAVSVLKQIGVFQDKKMLIIDRLVYLRDKLVFMNGLVEIKINNLCDLAKEFDAKIGSEQKIDFKFEKCQNLEPYINIVDYQKFFQTTNLNSKI